MIAVHAKNNGRLGISNETIIVNFTGKYSLKLQNCFPICWAFFQDTVQISGSGPHLRH